MYDFMQNVINKLHSNSSLLSNIIAKKKKTSKMGQWYFIKPTALGISHPLHGRRTMIEVTHWHTVPGDVPTETIDLIALKCNCVKETV